VDGHGQRQSKFGVMRGLDPRIHDEAQRRKSYGLRKRRFIMDCRVKPGNDSGEAV
jgi:hypothetical protein